MDVFDRATELEQMHRERSLAAARALAPRGISAELCVGCGAEIPLERRLAVPGCKRCFECQRVKEMRR